MFAEIDAETSEVIALRVPLEVRVASVTPDAAGDTFDVELEISSARHVLRRDQTDFDALLGALRDAQARGVTVLVTETDEHQIDRG